uniref:Uncharacterized protein n=1 Tax=Ixodes ricinus TaxID=34613 RepID=A0A6B0UUR1_IXORI
MSMISDCFSNSCIIFWIWGRLSCLFMFCMARVTPFMACAMAFWDRRVWILRDTAWMLARIRMNFFTWRLVRTRSLAMILTASIWLSLAIFLMSMMIFFSCCSILARSRSRSRMALFRARWFCLSISSGVFFLPNSHSISAVLRFR